MNQSVNQSINQFNLMTNIPADQMNKKLI